MFSQLMLIKTESGFCRHGVLCVRAYVRACVRARVRACVRACVRAYVRACVCVWFHESSVIIAVDVVSFARDCNSNFVCLQRTTKYF